VRFQDGGQSPGLGAATSKLNLVRQGERLRAIAAARPAPPPAVADILPEIYQTGANAVHDINAAFSPFSAERRAAHDKAAQARTVGEGLAAQWDDLKRTGRGFAAIPELYAAPVIGTARSLLVMGLQSFDAAMRNGAVALSGEDKIRQVEQELGLRPGGSNYDDAKQVADGLMMVLGPRGGMARAPRVAIPRALSSPRPPVEPIIEEGGGGPRTVAFSRRAQVY